MSECNSIIPIPESYANLLLITQSHLGGYKVSKGMEPYVFGRRSDGITVFDTKKAWEKFILAARAICGIKFPETISAVSGKTFGRKAVLKFSQSVGTKPITSRFIPGSFTNTTVKGSIEPRLIIVSDPVFDKQAVLEAGKVNCPVIGFCNTDASLSYVDIAIPVNNRSSKAIGAAFFILSNLINYIKNGKDLEKDIKNVELFFFRDVQELETLLAEQNAENSIQFAPVPSTKEEGIFGIPVNEGNSPNVW
ncbi:structural constituent of ribosome [Glugoides intestinalis]